MKNLLKLTLLFHAFLLYAQNPDVQAKIDSGKYQPALELVNTVLEEKQQNEKLLKQKADILYFLRKPKEAAEYYLLAIQQADKGDIPDHTFLGQCHTYLAECYGSLGLYEKAIHTQRQGLAYAEEAEYKNLIADGKFNLTTFYARNGQYDSALVLIQEVYQMDLESGDSSDISSDFNTLAFLYSQQNNHKKALNYYQQSIDYLKPTEDRKLATRYSNMAMAYMELEDFDQAKALHQKSYDLYEKIQDSIKMAQQKLNTGVLYARMKQYKTAQNFQQQAIDFYSRMKNSWAETRSRIELTQTLIAAGQYKKALRQVEAAVENCQKHNFLEELVEALKLKMQIQEKLGLTNQALETLKKHNIYKDSLDKSNQLRKLNNLELKFVTEQKEQEIEMLQLSNELQEASLLRQRRENLALIMGLAALLIFGGFVFITQRQKFRLKEALLSKEIDELRLQLSALLGSGGESLEPVKEEIDQKLKEPLSDREFDIFKLALTEKSNREMAEELFVSVNTVKYHLKNIYEKIGVSSRKEALKFMLKE